MATATINGITFTDLSTDEMLALVNSTARQFAPAPVAHKVERAIVEKAVSAPKAHSENGTIKLACGHDVPVSRGRYPKACPDCKGTPEKPREKAEKAPETPREGNDAWRLEPMSNNQRKRILGKLDKVEIDPASYETTKKLVNAEPRISAGKASDIWKALRAKS